WTLGDHLARLSERRARLSLDRVVMLALESSYATLPAPRQRLLRLLAIHPGRGIDSYAAAALAGIELSQAADDLAGLTGESLLARRASDRFEMHDLVRLFAADRAGDVDAPAARAGALTNLFDYYRYVTYRAGRLHEPHYVRAMELPEPATALPHLADRPAAVAWLEAERPNLIASALYCAANKLPDYISDFASLLHHYLYTIGHLRDAELLDRQASRVTRGVDRARALGRLGSVCSWLGRLKEARKHYQGALAVLNAEADRPLRARCLTNYGILCRRLGQFDKAIGCHEQARAIFVEHGQVALAGQQLGNVGQLYVLTGRHDDGVASLRLALAAATESSDRIGEADALGYLGFAALVAGQPRESFNHHHRALQIFVEIGDRSGESSARNGCGSALTVLGETERAVEQHRLAHEIALQVGDREGEGEALIEGGWALYHMAKFEDALDSQVKALRLSERTGNTWQQARAHDAIAHACQAIGDTGSAHAHRLRALSLHPAMRPADADRIAVKVSAP
ncbi:MAG TPA: tetratricopeptide repeat protein, partial [Candidatus Limnocylindrales bacterium]|nr:tetratricopeptide repeat protein [Candidatus Limnocylindrales bacterium]